jgi:hypothetical protein
MNYNALANATAITHITIVFLVLVGILISVRYKRFRPWESFILLFIVVLWSIYGNCPLTILEEHFRTLAGNPTLITAKGFLPFYANKYLGVSLLSGTVTRSTYFTGGMFTLASVEWVSPYINVELFKLRKLLGIKQKKNLKRKVVNNIRYTKRSA